MISLREADYWLKTFKEGWKKKDLSLLRELFSDIEEYYEGPFHEPATSVDEVMKLWNEIKKQTIKRLHLHVLAKEGDNVVVHWEFEDNSGSYDGIYHVAFNSYKKCIYFKQWTVKEK
ncbi:MAG: nuclear transport factor 2 family protein [Lactobacillus sp.]|jgi:hypothetical protein|nr:nuclear transport factor 2 family protein [Lactobacillus sp.]